MNFVKKISLKPSLRSFSLINNARFLSLNQKTLLSNNFNRFYSNVESSSSEKPNTQQNLKSSLEHDESKLEITPIRLKDWDPKTKDKPDYEGRLSLALKGLKVISISSLMVTTFGAPMLYFANQTTPIVVKLIASSVVMAFGFFTTGFLHFCAGPYVHKIWLVNKDTAVAQTMAYLGKKQFWKFQHKGFNTFLVYFQEKYIILNEFF